MNIKKMGIIGFAAVGLSACGGGTKGPVVYMAKDASRLERFCASELRRYLYLTTGEIVPIRAAASAADLDQPGIIIGRNGRLLGPDAGFDVPSAPDAYRLKTVTREGRAHVVIAAGEGYGILYGTYAFVEKLGVRFDLDGDVLPDKRIEFRMPDLDESRSPLFARRGIQPFHDFPEGPDWWDEDVYKAVLGQLPKLGMNFFGLHTYPEKNPNAEPTVWIGPPGAFGPDGNVTESYPSSYMNTLRENKGSHNWGFRPRKTGDFRFGADGLFERDDFGPAVMDGLMPEPATVEGANELFNRTAAMLRAAFSFARELGVRIVVGTETPLTVPAAVRERLIKAGKNPSDPAVVKELYKGIFGRIAKAYPIDSYWFWTSENWTWSDANEAAVKAVATDLAMAVEAAREIRPPFELATCGWVLGPPSRRTLFDEILPKSVAVSCINREVGKAPVDPGFAAIEGRSKWAIPWLEDDPSLTSPQFWAGRMRRDAADARSYGCDGLLGIHWRTRVLSPNVRALAAAAWDQSWNALPADLYLDWARNMFGGEAAGEIAAIFSRMDGKLPIPVTWTDGPGGIVPDGRPWAEVEPQYAFVDELEALRPRLLGAGSIERFNYWLKSFEYMREIARFRCLWGEYKILAEKAAAEKDAVRRKVLAETTLLPLRIRMIGVLKTIMGNLLATAGTTGELGTIANWEQHNMPVSIEKPAEELRAMLGGALPPEAEPPMNYEGPPRIIIPASRTAIAAGEDLTLKVIIFSASPVDEAVLLWREMGKGKFQSVPLARIARSVYRVVLPAPKTDIEYSIRARSAGRELIYPATAPSRPQTVIIY